MKRSHFLLASFGLLAHWANIGALEPGFDKPYRLQIVLHIAENRFLTPVFQDQVERDLRDRLQLDLGALARVEIVRTHPLLRAIEARGLENALDGSDMLVDVKTHFVLIN